VRPTWWGPPRHEGGGTTNAMAACRTKWMGPTEPTGKAGAGPAAAARLRAQGKAQRVRTRESCFAAAAHVPPRRFSARPGEVRARRRLQRHRHVRVSHASGGHLWPRPGVFQLPPIRFPPPRLALLSAALVVLLGWSAVCASSVWVIGDEQAAALRRTASSARRRNVFIWSSGKGKWT
jgi:hypothetical protein